MILKETRLASTDEQAVLTDVKSLFPDWNEGRQTLRLDGEGNILPFTEVEGEMVQRGNSPSGYRIDIVPINDRVLEQAEYDEEGTQTKESTYAGETRINIIAPDFVDMPEFQTRVNPSSPDSRHV